MKRVLFATVALSVLTSSSLLAADIPARMPTKAPAYAPVYNWTGGYVGINGGGAWGNSNWGFPGGTTGDFKVSAGMVGGTIGYNMQTGPWVWGVEGDLDWTNLKGSTNAACAAGCNTANSWLGTVRGRVGYAWNTVMPYLTGGLAVGNIKANIGALGQQSSTEAGWTVGGGVEAAIAGRWTAKVEYLYVDLGDMSCNAGSCGVPAPTNVDLRANVVRGGINYRF